MIVEAVALVCLIWYAVVVSICLLGIIQLYAISRKVRKLCKKLTKSQISAGILLLHVLPFPFQRALAHRMLL